MAMLHGRAVGDHAQPSSSPLQPADAFNNMGVGVILAGVVVPAINGTLGDADHIGAWLVFDATLVAPAGLTDILQTKTRHLPGL
jgi:hypothetical protein